MTTWLLMLAMGGCPRDPAAPDRLEVEVFDPYVADLAAGDLDAARTGHTSDGYRARIADVRYLAGHARNADEVGATVDVRIERVERTTDPDGTAVWRATGVWVGERGALPVYLDVVSEDGAWRLHRTWGRRPDGTAYPRVF